MKNKFWGHAIELTAKQDYTVELLFELLRREGRFDHAPELKTKFGVSAIFFPGAGGYENVMGVRKSKITLQQAKTTMGGALKSLALEWLTDSWSHFFNMEGGKNAEIMKSIAQETERLVCQ
ncbi:MAG: hypothetical protein LBD04_10670 [Synergistaceae bacterium]|jgi:hypothetical protein|nr:hypothetical protein [Synergistaceae bacterium]